MKKIALIIVLVMAFQQLFAFTYQKEFKNHQTVVDTLKKDGIDPVCKMKVKAGNTKTVLFNKVTYGFCSESCKKSFASNPKNISKNKLNTNQPCVFYFTQGCF